MAELKSTIKLDTNDVKAAAGMKRMTAEAAALVKELKNANAEIEKIGRGRRGGGSSFVGPQAPAGSTTSKGVTITPAYKAQIEAAKQAAKETAKAERAAAAESKRIAAEAASAARSAAAETARVKRAALAESKRIASEEAATARAAAKAVAAAEREKDRASKEALKKEVAAYRTRQQATRQVEAQAYAGASPTVRRDLDIGRLNASSKAAGISITDSRYTTALDGINKKFEAATKSAGGLSTAVTGVASAVGLLVGVSTALDLARKATEAGDSYVNLRARLLIATGSMAEAGKAQAEVVRIAMESGTALEAVGALYVRVAMNAKELGVTADQTVRAVQLVGKAIQVSGASASESAAATQQFAQALAAGRLNGDELRSILENAPRLAKAIADGLGVPVGQLKKLGEEGVLSSKLVLSALQSQGEVLDAEFSKLPVTVGRASQQARNSLSQYVGEVMNSAGATTTLGKVISELSNYMGAVVGAGSVVATVLATIALRTGAASLGMTKLSGDMTAAALSSTRFAGATGALNFALGALPAIAMAATVALVAVGKAAADNAERTAMAVDRMTNAVIDGRRQMAEFEKTGSKATLAKGIMALRQEEKRGEAELENKQKEIAGQGFFTSDADKQKAKRDAEMLVERRNLLRQERTLAEERGKIAGLDLNNLGNEIKIANEQELAQAAVDGHIKASLTAREKFLEKKKQIDADFKKRFGEGFDSRDDYKKVIKSEEDALEKKERGPKVKSLEAKEFANVKAQAEAEYNLVVEKQRQVAELREKDLAEGKISYKKAIDQAVESAKILYDAQVKSLEAQKKEAQTALGDKDKGVQLRAKTEIAKIDGELEVAAEKHGTARKRIEREMQDEIRRTKDTLEELLATEAQAARRLSPEQIDSMADRAFFDREREADKLGDPKVKAGVQAAKQRYKVGLQIDVDKQTIDDAFSAVDVVTQRLNLAVQNGQIGSIEANKGIQVANQLALKSAQDLLPTMERLAKKMGIDGVLAVEQYKLKIEQLKRTIDPVATAINDKLGSSLDSATKGLIRGQMTFREALFSVFDGLADELAGTASKSFSSAIMKFINDKGFNVGDMLSRAMGTAPSALVAGESGGIPTAASILGIGAGKNGAGLPIDPATGAVKVTLSEGVGQIFGGGANGDEGMFGGIWDKAKTVFGEITDSLGGTLSGIFGNFGGGMSSLFSSFGSGLSGIFSSLGSMLSGIGGGGGGGGSWIGAIASAFAGSFATGGHVRGPGTTTSDSIWARLSDDEFVINAASARIIGYDRLHNLNRIGSPGYTPVANKTAFNSGGHVSASDLAEPAGSGGGVGTVGVRVINSIDPEVFGDYLASPAGEKLIMNHIKRGGPAIKTLIGAR